MAYGIWELYLLTIKEGGAVDTTDTALILRKRKIQI
jgi:hypothetical protein